MASRYIYIAEELNQRLKEEENASALICGLLRDHYTIKDLKDMTPEEIDKRIQILRTKLEAKRKIEAIQNG